MSRYRRTGRKPGRPRRAATSHGRVSRATHNIDLSTFPALESAVERILIDPRSVIHKGGSGGGSTVFYLTPKERSQILAAAWWVYCNRDTWHRTQLLSAVEILSPLMLFSSAFFTELVRLPRDTVTKHMIKPPDAPISRVMGSASPWILRGLLTSSREGSFFYRSFLRETLRSKEAPKSFLSRLSGVPERGLLQPERGVDFFPERHDLLTGVVNREEMSSRGPHDPDPGPQEIVRHAFAGEDVGSLLSVMAPYLESGGTPAEECIPGYAENQDSWHVHYQMPRCETRSPGEAAQESLTTLVAGDEQSGWVDCDFTDADDVKNSVRANLLV